VITPWTDPVHSILEFQVPKGPYNFEGTLRWLETWAAGSEWRAALLRVSTAAEGGRTRRRVVSGGGGGGWGRGDGGGRGMGRKVVGGGGRWW
jgi:hypothetical protein